MPRLQEASDSNSKKVLLFWFQRFMSLETLENILQLEAARKLNSNDSQNVKIKKECNTSVSKMWRFMWARWSARQQQWKHTKKGAKISMPRVRLRSQFCLHHLHARCNETLLQPNSKPTQPTLHDQQWLLLRMPGKIHLRSRKVCAAHWRKAQGL